MPKLYSYIRFSSAEQRKGNSLERQLKQAQDYADKHNLQLDTMTDEGLSAFSGAHCKVGALSIFLKAIENGKIEPGSILLVETFDRLSRQDVLTALALFQQIINAGVKIVTLNDNQEYTQESINQNPTGLMFSILLMAQSHEESKKKSERLSAAWATKRRNAEQKPLTARCPLWLKLSKGRTHFEVIKERADVIRQIYDLRLQGLGMLSIAQNLNQNPNIWQPEKGFQKFYIRKILSDRIVLGEFQPKIRQGNKRINAGEPIKNYYPPIIDRSTFLKVQQIHEQNKHFSGRQGKISNLFGGLLRCGYCQGSMAYVSKSQKQNYLVCDNARLKIKCKRFPVRYDEVEKLILQYCNGLNLDEILNDKAQNNELSELENKLVIETDRNDKAQKRSLNLIEILSDETTKDLRKALKEKLQTELDIAKHSALRKSELKSKIKELQSTKSELQNRFDTIQLLSDRLTEPIYREKIRTELRSLIDKIVVYPRGLPLVTPENHKQVLRHIEKLNPNLKGLQLLEDEIQDRIENKDYRQYKVFFKTGVNMTFQPGAQNKIHFEFEKDTNKIKAAYTLEYAPLFAR